jgi:Fur family ferric uptake transcriptional regulator
VTRRVEQRATRGPGKRTQTLAELRGAIRGAGMRSTAPRLAVLERLRRAAAPMTHAEITAALTPLGFDRATIYRNLVDLAGAGLATRIELGDHVWRYEVRRTEPRSAAREHPHFVCNDCGTVSCLPSVRVAIRPAPGRRSPVASVSEIVLKGRCGSC